MWQEEIAEEVGSFPRQLRRHVVDRADEYPWALQGPNVKGTKLRILYHLSYPESLLVLVSVCIVEAEGLVDGRALIHELDGATGVGRDVAYGQ